jgi:hypothetical protein
VEISGDEFIRLWRTKRKGKFTRGQVSTFDIHSHNQSPIQDRISNVETLTPVAIPFVIPANPPYVLAEGIVSLFFSLTLLLLFLYNEIAVLAKGTLAITNVCWSLRGTQ